MTKIVCICLSSTIQKTALFKTVHLESVNRSFSYIVDAAGKAVNSARVLNQLTPGCVTAICPVGIENSEEFINLAEKDGFKLIAIKTPGKTRECVTLVDKTCHGTTEIVIGEPEPKENFCRQEEELLSAIQQEIKECDAVLLAGSHPAGWSKELFALIAKIVTDAGKIFLADYCGNDLKRTLDICIPTIIKINETEFASTFELSTYPTEQEFKDIITIKSQEFNNTIIVTRGTKSTLAAEKGAFTEFPCEKIMPVNTTACGDSFNAGFLHEYLETGDFSTALAKGTWCAARNAESIRCGSLN